MLPDTAVMKIAIAEWLYLSRLIFAQWRFRSRRGARSELCDDTQATQGYSKDD